MTIGAQLYSVRSSAQTPQGIRDTFRRVREMGYESVQVSGLGKIEPEALRDISQEFSLPIVCTHVDPRRLREEPAQVAAEHRIFGCRNIGISAMPEQYRGSLDGCRQFVRDYAPAAALLEEQGMRLCYHNHAFEFAPVDGACSFDLLLALCPSWPIILDTYWLVYAGADLPAYIERLAGRLECVHLKDMRSLPQGEMSAIGDGAMDFQAIVRQLRAAGTQHFLVEQDNADESGQPFALMQRSLLALKKLQWEA